jgi:hypothetical protein
MGRFTFSAEKTSAGCGNIDAASAVSLVLQGVSAGPCHSNEPAFRLSFSSPLTVYRLPEQAPGNGGSPFVTIGDYVHFEGENPWGIFAKVGLSALRTGRAGKRADGIDALEMGALVGERWAGCDAGKRVFEPTAGSLAKGALSAGRKDRMSDTARLGGNERYRVKC